MAFNEAGDEAGCLCLLDEIAQELSSGGVLPRRADRLLHGGKLPVENPGARQSLDIFEQPGAETGERVELFVDKLVEGGVAAFRPDQTGVLGVAVLAADVTARSN